GAGRPQGGAEGMRAVVGGDEGVGGGRLGGWVSVREVDRAGVVRVGGVVGVDGRDGEGAGRARRGGRWESGNRERGGKGVRPKDVGVAGGGNVALDVLQREGIEPNCRRGSDVEAAALTPAGAAAPT